MSAAPEDSIAGRIILVQPSMLMIEVLEGSRLLDVGFGVKLDMEGGRTGRMVSFRPSRLIAP